MLVSIIGNNASGKTSLAAALGEEPGVTAYLESHEDRPYQGLFAQEPQRYALPNQLDFYLARAEQERAISAAVGIGVQDGGLDQDFHLYTHLFHHKGFLSAGEMALCRRLYTSLRSDLPGPDLFIYLAAPLETLQSRLLDRGRVIDLNSIVTLDDLPVLQGYLDAWTAKISPLILEAERISLDSKDYLQGIAVQIQTLAKQA